jgi:hypothetical protein
MNAIGNDRSAAQIAQVIERVAGDDVLVVGVQAFPLSLPFYLQQEVILASDDAAEMTSNYLIQHFDGWVERSPALRPADWWREVLLACQRPTVFVVKAEDAEQRRTMDVSLNLLIDTGRYAAYGPCGTTSLAAVLP